MLFVKFVITIEIADYSTAFPAAYKTGLTPMVVAWFVRRRLLWRQASGQPIQTVAELQR